MLLQYETKRLVLKVLKTDAAPMVLDFYNRDKELFEKYEIDRMPDFYTVKHHQKLLKFEYGCAIKTSMVRYYVFLKDNPEKIIGTVCLHNINPFYYGSTEIGYKFSSEYHHQGYAAEAISCCLWVAFNELKLNRVTAVVCVGNEPSARLLTKLGFKNEALLREYLNLHGQWTDHTLYSLLRSDCGL